MDEATPQRRRRRRRQEEPQSLLRDRRVGPALAGVMTLAALAYLASAWLLFSSDAGGFANAYVGASPQEVLYFVGRPDRVKSAGSEQWSAPSDPSKSSDWLYDRKSARLRIQFDPATGGVDRILCSSVRKQAAADCPSPFGVAVGDSEIQLLDRIGQASRERLNNGSKLMHYDELGYEFRLDNFFVTAISYRGAGPSTWDRLIRFLRWALP